MAYSKTSLDSYDDRPEDMKNYLKYYGWHFNKKMCDFAISKMTKNDKPLVPIAKELADAILKKFNIKLDNNTMYDYVYLFNQGKADYYGDAFPSEEILAKYVKCTLNDEDAYDGMPFSHFYIDTVKKGLPIDWSEML